MHLANHCAWLHMLSNRTVLYTHHSALLLLVCFVALGSMGNSGKNSNSSQFFFTFDKAPQCDGKHVIFGEVVSGHDVLKRAETFGSPDGNPSAPIRITHCGLFVPLLTPGAGYWYDKPDAESWNGISPTFQVRPRVAIAAPEAAKNKFKAAIGSYTSIVLSVGVNEDNAEDIRKQLWEALSSFSVDLLVIAPACKDLESKLGDSLPELWKDTNIALDEVVLVSKPLDVMASIHTKSWLAKHREHWNLDGQH